MKVKISENVYEMMCESRLMFGFRNMVIKGGVERNLCNSEEILQENIKNTKIRSKWVTELEMGRDSRRNKELCLAVKYWLRISQMDKEELVRVCYEYQIIKNLEPGQRN
jgi:hypothetical protein